MRYLTERDLTGERGCVLSECRAYRYRLWRAWDRSLPTLAFVMLNPSTADHVADDPTIMRCVARAVAGKFGWLEVVNLYPLRATDPDALLTHPDPLGPGFHADAAIMDTVERAEQVICGWGAHPAAAPRAADVVHMLITTDLRAKLYHLGLNKDGSPKHPRYIAASTRPEPLVFHGV